MAGDALLQDLEVAVVIRRQAVSKKPVKRADVRAVDGERASGAVFRDGDFGH